MSKIRTAGGGFFDPALPGEFTPGLGLATHHGESDYVKKSELETKFKVAHSSFGPFGCSINVENTCEESCFMPT